MPLNPVKQINWLDIALILLLLRICYTSFKKGAAIEFFKLLGLINGAYLSLHYFTVLADFIDKRFSIQGMPLQFLDFLCFLVLAIFGYLVFVLLRSAFAQIIKIEAVSRLAKLAGLALGIARALLTLSLIIFILLVSSIGNLKNAARNSYLGKRLFNIAPATYAIIWHNIISKFATQESSNKTILEVQKDLNL